MSYEIKTHAYNGPLDKLLELIEGKKLEITLVNLGQVTGDFLEYIKTVETGLHPRILSDFIVVASRLMLIKSKALLPDLELTEEEERDIHDLEERLKIYKEFKAAGLLLKKSFGSSPKSFSRPLMLGVVSIFYPAKNLTIENIAVAMRRLISALEVFAPKEERVIKKVLVTLEEKMSELMTRLVGAANGSFSAFSANMEKGEVVILFLAMLHLIKQQKISISQKGQFDDIVIEKLNAA